MKRGCWWTPVARRLALAVLALALLPSPARPVGAQAVAAVLVGMDQEPETGEWVYSPAAVSITAGERVIWENGGLEIHTVSAEDGSFDSGILDSGQRFEVLFPAPGEYRYRCALHPSMSGVIMVAEATPRRLYFGQTGFALDDPAFIAYFRSRGGARTLGYPISRRFRLLGAEVQLFQRFALRRDPDGLLQPMNLLDEAIFPYTRFRGLTIPAADPALLQRAPAPTRVDYATAALAFVHDQVPDTFEGQPVGFARAYFGSVTCADAYPGRDCQEGVVAAMALELWGLPTSAPLRDPNNRDFVYQRFQRGVLHFDARSGTTQGLLLGDVFKSLLTGESLPPDLEVVARGSPFYRQYDAASPNGLARPDELPLSDLRDAFQPELS